MFPLVLPISTSIYVCPCLVPLRRYKCTISNRLKSSHRWVVSCAECKNQSIESQCHASLADAFFGKMGKQPRHTPVSQGKYLTPLYRPSRFTFLISFASALSRGVPFPLGVIKFCPRVWTRVRWGHSHLVAHHREFLAVARDSSPRHEGLLLG